MKYVKDKKKKEKKKKGVKALRFGGNGRKIRHHLHGNKSGTTDAASFPGKTELETRRSEVGRVRAKTVQVWWGKVDSTASLSFF